MSRAREIADERFARGEIDAAEHQRIIATLGTGDGSAQHSDPEFDAAEGVAKYLTDTRAGCYLVMVAGAIAAPFLVASIWGEQLARWVLSWSFVKSAEDAEAYLGIAVILMVVFATAMFSDWLSDWLRNRLVAKLNEHRPAAPVARLLAVMLARTSSGVRKEVSIDTGRIAGDVITSGLVTVKLRVFWPAMFAFGAIVLWGWIKDR